MRHFMFNLVVNSTNVIVDNNLYFGGNGSFFNGTNAIHQNPEYVNSSLTIVADFYISSTSPAVDRGSSNLAPTSDFNGNPRPYGSGYDIGAYEFGSTLNIKDFESIENFLFIYPNPTSDYILIKGDVNIREFEIFDLTGKRVLKSKLIKSSRIDIIPI